MEKSAMRHLLGYCILATDVERPNEEYVSIYIYGCSFTRAHSKARLNLSFKQHLQLKGHVFQK